MNDEEIKKLAEKIVSGEASKEETLQYTKELNAKLEELKKELQK